MYLTITQLFFGNAALGVLEGAVLRALFAKRRKCRLSWCIPWMILANYVSAWFVMVLVDMTGYAVPFWGAYRPGDSLLWHRLVTWAWMYALTVVLELPLVCIALRDPAGYRPNFWTDVPRATWISAAIQAMSYMVLVPVAILAAKDSAVTEWRYDPSLLNELRGRGTVFYSHDGAFWQIGLDGTDRRKRLDREFTLEDLHLKQDPNTERWALLAGPGSRQTLLDNLALPVEPTGWKQLRQGGQVDLLVASPYSGPLDYRPLEDRLYLYYVANWGLFISRPGEDALDFSLDTVSVRWLCSSATVLPDHLLVATCGPGIVVLHPPTGRYAFLADGKWAFAVPGRQKEHLRRNPTTETNEATEAHQGG